MVTLQSLVRKYYTQGGYNCSETLLRAGNEYYNLGLHDEDMKCMAGFGGGMFVGATCGALIGSVAVLSKIIVKTKAHDHLDEIKKWTQILNRNFRYTLGATDCAHVKMHHNHKTPIKCLNTCLLAAHALEKTVNEWKK